MCLVTMKVCGAEAIYKAIHHSAYLKILKTYFMPTSPWCLVNSFFQWYELRKLLSLLFLRALLICVGKGLSKFFVLDSQAFVWDHGCCYSLNKNLKHFTIQLKLGLVIHVMTLLLRHLFCVTLKSEKHRLSRVYIMFVYINIETPQCYLPSFFGD